MPLQATSGAASYDGFGGGVAAVPNYIEDVFSTYLYNGNEPNSVTVNNGIDLSTKGGLVWIKARETAKSNWLWDTARGTGSGISSNTTGAAVSFTGVSAFNTNGFTVGSDSATNDSTRGMASWTFRKQPKFFDVVTVSHTNGVDNTIDFSGLGTVGCVIIKRTDGVNNWYVWHRSLGNAYYGLFLNSTGAPSNFGTAPVSVSGTTVTMTDSSAVGSYFSTGTYVVYAYAHNAGGFGLTGTDNVISCGSFTTDGSGNATVSLGYEPQLAIIKASSTIGNWDIIDNMRGFPVSGNDQTLRANLSNAEATLSGYLSPNATGFSIVGGASVTYIYIAIRRGPMKVPTSGTSVFAPLATRSSGSSQSTPLFNAGWPVDLMMQGFKSGNINNAMVIPRLTNNILRTSNTDAETNGATSYDFGGMLGVISVGGADNSSSTICGWNFRRAPSFFDEVCYTGNSTSGATQTHNLGVVPELMIVKGRSVNANWFVYSQTLGATKYLILNDTGGSGTLSSVWNDTAPTSTTFTLGNAGAVNASGGTYVAYLFATCAGVSKVGSYVGDDTIGRVINCGFTSGARFIMLKKTSTTSDWYVYDTARGIVSAGESSLSLNTTAAESGSSDVIDPDSTGFAVGTGASNFFNETGVTYIYLAIA